MAQLKSLLITGAASFAGAATFNNTLNINKDIKLGSSANLYYAGGTTYGLFSNGNAKTAALVVNSLTDSGTLSVSGISSMSNSLVVTATNAGGSYDEGIRINIGKSNYSSLTFGTTGNNDIQDGAWWMGTNNSTYARRLMIAHNGSTATGTYFYSDSASQISPSLRIGSNLVVAGTGSFGGKLTLMANQYNDGYDGALNMQNSNIYGVNSIYTADASENPSEGIHFYRDGSHVDTLWAGGGNLYFNPNRELGTNGTDYLVSHDHNSMVIGNTSWINNNSNMTLNDLALKNYAAGMINSATDNPTGNARWVHAISMNWSYGVNTSWVSQIALGVNEGTGMWYRTNSGTIVGRGWKRIIDSDILTISTVNNIGLDAGLASIGYVSGLTKAAWNGQQTDGALYQQVYSSSWKHQIFGDYRTGQLAVRGKNNGTFTDWRVVLDSVNYTSYAATSGHNHDSRYVLKAGDTMTGDLGIPVGKSSIDGSVPIAGSTKNVSENTIAAFRTALAESKTYLGAMSGYNGWQNVLSIRHRNGQGDGNAYGMYFRSSLTASDNLIWGKQYSSSSWQDERTILDSANYTNYTYSISLAADSGTSSIQLSANTKYKLTAGGKSLIFTTPVDNNTVYTHPSYAAANAAAVKVGRDSTGHVVLGDALTYSDVDAAPSSHTHGISLAADSGTNQITLAYGTKYKLTAGGKSVIFTMPSSDNTNTWRGIQVNGTDKLTDSSTKINFKAGSNVSLSYNSGTITINSSYTDTDTHYTTGLYIGATNTKSNAVATNPYIKLYDNDTKRSEFRISGSGATSVTSDASGNLTISSTNTNTWRPIQVGGTDKLTDSSTKLNFAGSGATSVSYSNGTITISSTNTNTWRPIQDNLTSKNNTDDSLSANQGYNLANGSARDSTKLPLSGGTMTGALNFANGTWNNVGDDVAIGDHNSGGSLGIKGLNGVTKISLLAYNDNSKIATISWDGSTFSLNGYTLLKSVPSDAKFTDTVYTHPTYHTASAAAVKVGRDGTGHVVLGNALTYRDVGAASSGHGHTTLNVSSKLIIPVNPSTTPSEDGAIWLTTA